MLNYLISINIQDTANITYCIWNDQNSNKAKIDISLSRSVEKGNGK